MVDHTVPSSNPSSPPVPPPSDPGEASPGFTPAPLRGVLSSERKAGASRGNRSVRVALAHDWVVGRRGGEAVLERIAAILKNEMTPAGLYTLFHKSGTTIGPATDSLEVTASSLSALPMSKAFRRWLLPAYPYAVGSLSRKLARDHAITPIRLLVSTSSGLVKGLAAPGVPHLCYCHAPARYLWSVQDEYTRGGLGGSLRKLGFAAFTKSLRAWDRRTATNVTAFVANSRHTAKEIERVFDREAAVIHPPVRTELFTPDPDVPREDFWLVVSALEPYKRVDLAIDAAMIASKRLMIAGTGSQLGALKAHAKKEARRLAKAGYGKRRDSLITFMGRVSDQQLVGLYRRAALFIFPQVEDFGITAVEAQACGCPVLARRAGGALDTVLEGRTGVLFTNPEPEAIRKAAKRVPEGVADQCRRHAERFSEAAFDARMRVIIDRMLDD